MDGSIRVEDAGPVRVITIDRPDKMNALTLEMYEALAAAFASVPVEGTRCLLIRGAGGRAFAAGTDIAVFRDFKTPEHGVAYERRIDEILSTIERCPLPVIAAMAGVCTGGGAAIAAVCDLRLATRDLRFGFPIARTLGNCLSAASLARLTALLGAGRVKDLIFKARLMDAAEALNCGLLSEVLDDATALDGRAMELAIRISGFAPLTLSATKELLRRNAVQGGVADDHDIVAKCYTSEDFREGLHAFLAKRPAVWTGR